MKPKLLTSNFIIIYARGFALSAGNKEINMKETGESPRSREKRDRNVPGKRPARLTDARGASW